jgi:UDP-glucuronate 4-epimerase
MIEQSLGMIAQLRQEPLQPGDVLRTWADISKAATILGYSPKTAIEDGIPAFAQWFKSVHPEWFPSSVRPAA